MSTIRKLATLGLLGLAQCACVNEPAVSIESLRINCLPSSGPFTGLRLTGTVPLSTTSLDDRWSFETADGVWAGDFRVAIDSDGSFTNERGSWETGGDLAEHPCHVCFVPPPLVVVVETRDPGTNEPVTYRSDPVDPTCTS